MTKFLRKSFKRKCLNKAEAVAFSISAEIDSRVYFYSLKKSKDNFILFCIFYLFIYFLLKKFLQKLTVEKCF